MIIALPTGEVLPMPILGSSHDNGATQEVWERLRALVLAGDHYGNHVEVLGWGARGASRASGCLPYDGELGRLSAVRQDFAEGL